MVEIREIDISEHDFLNEMLREAAFFPDPSKKIEKLAELEPILTSYFENFGQPGEIALVVVTADGLSGAVWTRRFKKERNSHGYIDDETPELGIAIKEQLRNQGVGTEMIRAIIGRLADQGFARVSLGVDKRNPAARLYERLGFQVHSEAETSYTMVKHLERA